MCDQCDKLENCCHKHTHNDDDRQTDKCLYRGQMAQHHQPNYIQGVFYWILPKKLTFYINCRKKYDLVYTQQIINWTPPPEVCFRGLV